MPTDDQYFESMYEAVSPTIQPLIVANESDGTIIRAAENFWRMSGYDEAAIPLAVDSLPTFIATYRRRRHELGVASEVPPPQEEPGRAKRTVQWDYPTEEKRGFLKSVTKWFFG